MIKLCHVITRSDSVGGAQVHVLDLSRSFRERGVDVTVLVGGSGPFTKRLEESGVPTLQLQSLRREIAPFTDWSGYLEIRRVLRMLQPDIVMLHSSKAGWLGRLACRRLGIPAVFTVHGWAFTEGVNPLSRRMYRLVERMAGTWADRIITVSEHDRQLALKARIGSPTSLVTIHNGAPDIAGALAEPGKAPPRIAVVARMDAQKDHALLFRSIATLQEIPWSLELIGDGDNRGHLENLARSLGIWGRISWLGAINNVAERLAQAQLGVLPSHWEGFPRSLVEAMRAGLPVVASNVGGVAECVAHGLNGYLVPRGDSRAMASYVKQLIVDPERRVAMGMASRRRYLDNFTLDHMFQETVAVVKDVFADRNRTDLAEHLATRVIRAL